MNMNVKAVVPVVYATAVFVGFLINTTTGIIIAIGGAMISAAIYTVIARKMATAGTSRRQPRQRNRAR